MSGKASEGNLLGSVPAITTGDLNIAESTAIIRYVADTRKPNNSVLYPADQKKRALVN